MIPRFFWLVVAVGCIGCQLSEEKVPDGLLSDSIPQQIFNFQDLRNADELYSYTDHSNKTYRELAVSGFGSVQDTSYIQKLFAIFLKDKNPEIRAAAAFALGQTYDSAAALLLMDGLLQESSLYVRKISLEAIGKSISQVDLPKLYSIETTDSLEEQGLAAGLYYALIRNVYDTHTLEMAVSFLGEGNSFPLRLWGANYLSRIRNIDLCPFIEDVLLQVSYEKNPEIRSRIASGLRNCKEQPVKQKLIQLMNDVDYRVRVEAVRSMTQFLDAEGMEAVILRLKDEHHQVSTAAAEMLNQNVSKLNYPLLQNIDLNITDLRAKRNIQDLMLQFGDSLQVGEELMKDYSSSEDSYDRAQILRILGKHLPSFDFVVTQLFSSEEKEVMNAAMSSLARFRRRDDLPGELKIEADKLIQKAIETGDLALVTIGTGLIADQTVDFKPAEGNFDFLRNFQKERVSDQDAWTRIQQTLAELDSVEHEEPEQEHQAIDWEYASSLEDIEFATIHTSEGEVRIKLFVSEAPGSVTNFLKLAESDFYDGIAFHRVVPDFVAQAGCNRGDGWGGPDYSIRSEFTQRKYKPGSVGMASAGKDTEGSQFFITHTSTPHLDGRYTIFAEVIEGMDVVARLSVGSRILDIVREDLHNRK